MEVKLKECTGCGKDRAVWKRFRNQPYCKVCATNKDKEKKKAKRQKKRDTITEKKLDTLVSKVIRTLYGDKCVTCGNIGTLSTNHCGHALSRQFRVTRCNPENLGTQCPRCNLYLQGAQYEYGKFINVFHGPDTMEKLIKLSKSDIKIGQVERNEIWKVYQDALVHGDLKKLISDYYKIFEQ